MARIVVFVALGLVALVPSAAAGPEATSFGPIGIEKDARPVIRVTFAAPGVDPAGTEVRLDGGVVPLLESAARLARAQPVDDLEEGTHLVNVTFRDAKGRAGFAEWSFRVDAEIGQGDVADREARIASVGFAGGLVREMSAIEVRFDGSKLVATLDEVPLEVSGGGGRASVRPVRLADGPHELVLVATGANSTEARHAVAFVVDATPPTILLASLEDLPGSFEATWSDANGVGGVRVRLDRAAIAFPESGGRIELPTLAPGRHSIRIDATDSAGNVATKGHAFDVAGASGTPLPALLGLVAVALASLLRRPQRL